jgi:hypothetical protein
VIGDGIVQYRLEAYADVEFGEGGRCSLKENI